MGGAQWQWALRLLADLSDAQLQPNEVLLGKRVLQGFCPGRQLESSRLVDPLVSLTTISAAGSSVIEEMKGYSFYIRAV